MFIDKNKSLKFYIFFFIILIIFFYFFISQFQKKKDIVINPISINLLTSVHPNLPWDFKPVNSKVLVKPGEVTTIEYINMLNFVVLMPDVIGSIGILAFL